MASGWYVTGLKEIIDGTIDLDTTELKLMLVDDNYVYDADHDVVDNSGGDGSDPSHNELVATNYTGGFEGAGRKVATLTIAANKTDNRVDASPGDLTWSALGGASNDTIGGAILIKEGTDDTDSRLIAFFDVTDTPTNGGDITLDFTAAGSGGNLRLTLS